jgi:hypothetical protein
MKKQEGGIEKVFLAYANHPLRENPYYFREVCDAIESIFSFSSPNIQNLRPLAGFIVEIAKRNNPQIANYFVQEKPASLNAVVDNISQRIGAEAVYGYRDKFCEFKCPKRAIRAERIDKKLLEGPERLKCYECQQLHFVRMLSEIVGGEEFSEIRGFSSFVSDGYKFFKQDVRVLSESKAKAPFKTKLQRAVNWNPGDPLYCVESGSLFGPYKFAFQHFLDGLIAFSLCEFLLDSDRRKLRRCEWCGTFFVASKVDSRIKYCAICSPKSKWSKETRREYQRKYWAKHRKAKEVQERIQYIDRLMDAGCTKEEAEKEYAEIKEADKDIN